MGSWKEDKWSGEGECGGWWVRGGREGRGKKETGGEGDVEGIMEVMRETDRKS